MEGGRVLLTHIWPLGMANNKMGESFRFPRSNYKLLVCLLPSLPVLQKAQPEMSKTRPEDKLPTSFLTSWGKTKVFENEGGQTNDDRACLRIKAANLKHSTCTTGAL